MDTGNSSDINMLSSSCDELGLSIGAWERPALLIKKQSSFLMGFLHCGVDTIIRVAFTPYFAGLDAFIVKRISTPRHVPGAILFIA